MSTRYEKQIERLVAYVKKLNQTVEERNQQLHYWQGYARKLREERQRLGTAMIGQVRRVLDEAAGRYREAQVEIRKQRDYIDHSTQLAQSKEITLSNQLRYAMARLDDLALERKALRQEMAEIKRRAWEAEDRLASLTDRDDKKVGDLEATLAAALDSQRRTAQELEAFREQVAIQEAQWREMFDTNQALASRLGQTEAALDKAKSALSDTLTSQTLSTAREVDDLRALVVSLQQQTEALRTEIATHQEAMQQQERFIALLKPGDRPQVRPLKRGSQHDPPASSDDSSAAL